MYFNLILLSYLSVYLGLVAGVIEIMHNSEINLDAKYWRPSMYGNPFK